MTTRQYIGARYIPVFADPVEWTDERTYEPLTMVQHLGETYMTKQAVPLGVQLPDTSQGEESNDYWVHMSNWNAQIETYRQEVLQYNGRISTLENDLPTSAFDSTNTVKKAIDDAVALLPGTAFDSTNTVKKAIDDAVALLPGTAFDSTNTVDARFDVIEANGWVGENRIASSAVTTAKIADGSVTQAKLGSDVSLGKDHTIILGDSWSAEPGTVKWPYYYAQQSGETLHNYAVSGATISPVDAGKGNTSMAPQIPLAIADTSFNHDDVGKIIIVAGVNDNSIWGNDYSHYSTIISALSGYISSLKSEFADAAIYFVMNYELPVDHIQDFNAKRVIDAVSIYCNATAAFGWLSPSQINTTDYTHPTADGHKKLGYDMFALTHGGIITRPVVITEVTPTWNKDVAMNTTIKFVETWHNWNDYQCQIYPTMIEGADGQTYEASATINARTAGLTRTHAMAGSLTELGSGLALANCYSGESERPGFSWVLNFGTSKQGADGTSRNQWNGTLFDRA